MSYTLSLRQLNQFGMFENGWELPIREHSLPNIQNEFVNSSSAIGRRFTSLLLAGITLYAAHAYIPRVAQGIRSDDTSSLVEPAKPAPSIVAPQIKPLSIAGYPELYGRQAFDTNNSNEAYWFAVGERARMHYLESKAELLDALEACRDAPASCHPNIKAFHDMLDQLKTFSDKKEQIEAFSGWVNLFIDYDYDEAGYKTPHRSLLRTLEDGTGVCDEQAQLKLFIAEYLGYPESDIRYIVEQLYKWNGDEGQPTDLHAVVAIRIGNTPWILNNNTPADADSRRTWSYNAVYQEILGATAIEKATTQVNLSLNSMFSDYGDRAAQTAEPLYSYNSRLHAVYGELDDSAAEIDQSAPQTQTALNDLPSFKKYGFEPMREFFNPAVAKHYNVTLAR